MAVNGYNGGVVKLLHRLFNFNLLRTEKLYKWIPIYKFSAITESYASNFKSGRLSETIGKEFSIVLL